MPCLCLQEWTRRIPTNKNIVKTTRFKCKTGNHLLNLKQFIYKLYVVFCQTGQYESHEPQTGLNAIFRRQSKRPGCKWCLLPWYMLFWVFTWQSRKCQILATKTHPQNAYTGCIHECKWTLRAKKSCAFILSQALYQKPPTLAMKHFCQRDGTVDAK